MTIEIPLEIDNQLKETARAQGVSIGQNTGAVVDGEEVMARLIAELASQ